MNVILVTGGKGNLGKFIIQNFSERKITKFIRNIKNSKSKY